MRQKLDDALADAARDYLECIAGHNVGVLIPMAMQMQKGSKKLRQRWAKLFDGNFKVLQENIEETLAIIKGIRSTF